jgi:hypothetical protein
VVIQKAELSIPLPAGDHMLELSCRDQFGQDNATDVTVRVMEPQAHAAMLNAVAAASHLSLWMVDEEIYLPLVVDE